jgi:hypothetical protein
VARVELGYRQQLTCVFGVELPIVADHVVKVAEDPRQQQRFAG